MPHEGSVTQWLREFKEGDQYAAAKLWERYWRRMRGLAHKQLGNARRRVADEEDAALSAFADFCEQVKGDGFKKGLEDREDLWQVLALLTKRKAIDHFRKDQRRGEAGESVLKSPHESQVAGAQNVEARGDVTPDAILQSMEEFDQLLHMLPDDQTRQIACLKLEGFNNHEISDQVGCALRTVERRIGQIKAKWAEELGVDTQ
ncbi:MAG: RNA polymerase subunit sigma-70 [Planctomycetaceae bacterium]|nr:RNA polymerase subunit sigma-70 [Planctomycetaceae bacterium]